MARLSLVLILFTRELMERAEVGRFLLLVNTIKTATMSLVMRDQLFE